METKLDKWLKMSSSIKLKSHYKDGILKITNHKGQISEYELRRGQIEAIEYVNENFLEGLLFVAPTAYGKTLPIVHYIIKVVKSGLKVIYCAPLKALTFEVTENLKLLGLRVFL